MLGTNLVSFREVLGIHLICLQHLARNVRSVGQWFAWKSYMELPKTGFWKEVWGFDNLDMEGIGICTICTFRV